MKPSDLLWMFPSAAVVAALIFPPGGRILARVLLELSRLIYNHSEGLRRAYHAYTGGPEPSVDAIYEDQH